MDGGSPSAVPKTSIQEPGVGGRAIRPEAPVDSMLKDMATVIFSTFLFAGWVAFIIIYPKVSPKVKGYKVKLKLRIDLHKGNSPM